jgi:hypothetical protein
MRHFYSVLSLLTLLLFTQPGFAAVMLIGGYTHDYNLVAGGQARGALSLRNIGRQAVEIKLYTEDIQNGQRYRRSNRKWVRLSTNRLIIPAGATRKVTYTIKAPRGNLRGTYWSALIVEPVSKNSVESDRKRRVKTNSGKKITVSINQVIRHAITLVTEFPGGKANIAFSAPKMGRDPKTKKRSFSLMVRNTGTAWVGKGVRSWIDVYNSQGVLVGKFEGERKGLFPGVSKRFSVDISRLRPGQYKGLFAIAPLNGKMFGANVNIRIK